MKMWKFRQEAGIEKGRCDVVPLIDETVIGKAKEMDLLTYLKIYEPSELVRIGAGIYCTREHDSLKISNGKWYWWSRGFGGASALDYLVKVKGYSFPEAVNRILCIEPAPQREKEKPPEERKASVLLLPPHHDNATAVLAYLEKRGIDSVIAMALIRNGFIYENRYISSGGREFINAVFVGYGENFAPKYAMLRGIDSDYKSEATGSDKRYTFSLSAQKESDTVHIFESAIDLLSYMTVLTRNGKYPRDQHLLSLAGVYQPKRDKKESKIPISLTQYTEDHAGIKNIVLHLDNDKAGRLATRSITVALEDKYKLFDEPPGYGKDYNDYLRLRFSKNYEGR